MHVSDVFKYGMSTESFSLQQKMYWKSRYQVKRAHSSCYSTGLSVQSTPVLILDNGSGYVFIAVRICVYLCDFIEHNSKNCGRTWTKVT